MELPAGCEPMVWYQSVANPYQRQKNRAVKGRSFYEFTSMLWNESFEQHVRDYAQGPPEVVTPHRE
jgi:hypothetical protein